MKSRVMAVTRFPDAVHLSLFLPGFPSSVDRYALALFSTRLEPLRVAVLVFHLYIVSYISLVSDSGALLRGRAEAASREEQQAWHPTHVENWFISSHLRRHYFRTTFNIRSLTPNEFTWVDQQV